MIGKWLVLEVELEGLAEVVQGSLYALPLAGDLHFKAAGNVPGRLTGDGSSESHGQESTGTANEVTAGIREHYDGVFAFGAPDAVVVNVTKEAIWIRDATLPGLAGSPRPNPLDMFPGGPDTMPDEVVLPPVNRPRETQQDPYLREIEIDPREYLPDDVYRDPVTSLPDEITIDLKPLKERLRSQLEQ